MKSLNDNVGSAEPSVSLEQEIETLATEDLDLSSQPAETPDTVAPPEPDEASRQPSLRKPGQSPSTEGKINLDDLPEFRNYKSTKDRELEAERQLRRQLEQQVSQQQQAQLQAYQQQLQEQMRSYDPDQQRAAVEQLAALKAQQYVVQMRAWENAKRQRLVTEGLNPDDQRWNKQYPGGEAGLRQFEAEIAAAKSDTLVKENKELKSKLESIDQVVKQKVAEALRGMGFDHTETGEDASPTEAQQRYKQDVRRLQLGEMPPEEFIKKYG